MSNCEACRVIIQSWEDHEDKVDIESCSIHAAAPDLLAALKDVMPMWESGISEPWVLAARAAIARAEGRDA